MWLVIAGWVASALVFSTFFVKTMLPLRVIAIVSNVVFMSYALLGLVYGTFGSLYPILVLHACLLPLNVTRFVQLRRATAATMAASDGATLRALAPYLTVERQPRGTMLFRGGDLADRLYVIRNGTVAVPEAGLRLSTGALFGEVGLFAPDGRRTATAVCATDCELLTADGAQTLRLCYEDPQLATLLLRLVAGYVPTAAAPALGSARPAAHPAGRPTQAMATSCAVRASTS